MNLLRYIYIYVYPLKSNKQLKSFKRPLFPFLRPFQMPYYLSIVVLLQSCCQALCSQVAYVVASEVECRQASVSLQACSKTLCTKVVDVKTIEVEVPYMFVVLGEAFRSKLCRKLLEKHWKNNVWNPLNPFWKACQPYDFSIHPWLFFVFWS